MASAIKEDTAMIGPGIVSVPNIPQRNPSTTPTIGFSQYALLHSFGTRLLDYATGVMNIQNCEMNGIV